MTMDPLVESIRQTLANASGLSRRHHGDKDDIFESRVLIPAIYDDDIQKYLQHVRYDVYPLSLATARSNEKIEFVGNFFQVLSLTDNASLDVSFNSIGQPVTFDGEQHIFMPFYRFFVTNTAQTGASVKIFVGNGCFYVPSYRTKMVSPAINLQKSYVKTIANTATKIDSWATDFVGYSVVRVDIFNAGSYTVYLGNSAVSAATGFPLEAGAVYTLNFSPHYMNTDLYGIVASGTEDLRIAVFGTS